MVTVLLTCVIKEIILYVTMTVLLEAFRVAKVAVIVIQVKHVLIVDVQGGQIQQLRLTDQLQQPLQLVYAHLEIAGRMTATAKHATAIVWDILWRMIAARVSIAQLAAAHAYRIPPLPPPQQPPQPYPHVQQYAPLSQGNVRAVT